VSTKIYKTDLFIFTYKKRKQIDQIVKHLQLQIVVKYLRLVIIKVIDIPKYE